MARGENNEISMHEVLVYNTLKTQPEKWFTAKDIKVAVGDKVHDRTIRSHLLRLVHLGIVDQLELFPGHRYRVSEKADKRNKTYFARLEQATTVLLTG